MEGHFMSGELNYRVEDIQKVIAAVKQRFAKDGKEDSTDGIRLSNDWRFNIRRQTPNPLRLNIEARERAWSKRSGVRSKRLWFET